MVEAEVKEEEVEAPVEEALDADVDDDDIFNTDFVNAITSGDVKLAVIPDDPVYDDDDDDPFNTAIADVVVKQQEEEKQQEAVTQGGPAIDDGASYFSEDYIDQMSQFDPFG